MAGSPSPPLEVLWRRGPGRGGRSLTQHATRNTLERSHAPRSLRSVLIVDPADFQHVVENGQLIGWRYSGRSPSSPIESQVFLPEEVWFERLPNPFDYWRGLSPLTVATLASKSDFAAAAFMHGLMENNADNGLLVRADQQLSDEQQEQIVAALKNRHCRAGAANRSLFLWGVNEIIQPKLSSADLQFLENRKFSRTEICAAFGVPEEIVTSTDHNKYDVMRGARLNFIENRIAPLCARLEASENTTTIPALLSSSSSFSSSSSPATPERSGGGSPSSLIENQKSKIENVVGWFDLDSLPIMQQARRDRIAAAKVGFDMGIPLNELNRLLDLGLAPLPWGDTGYLPASLLPAGTLHDSATAARVSIPAQNGAAVPQPTTEQLTSEDLQQIFHQIRAIRAIMRQI